MELIIHSYGYSGLIINVLNGLALFRNSTFYEVIVTTMTLMVGAYYAWKIAASGLNEQWKSHLRNCIGMLIFVYALILPTSSMFVRDHVEKSFKKVDNIPLAFSLPIGVVENYGHLLTHGFDQAFSYIGGKSSLSYYSHGTIFDARLAKEVLQAKIRDPEVASNMRRFVERCVVLPAMIGHKFTKEELVSTKDVWGLLKKAGGDLARVDMVQNNTRVIPSPTCSQAILYFEGKFASQSRGIIASVTDKFRGAGSGIEVQNYKSTLQLNKDMSAAIKELFNDNSVSVDSILKHNMMINSINSYRTGKYASARAQMHQEAGGLISGDIAEKTLTGSLALMKVILYSSYIFLLPMLILSGGFNRYKSWIIAAFSLALWPPLFTILNMVIDFAYDPAQIVSYSSWSTEKKKFDSIAGLAAGLSISIPFLAYYMTRLGEGGFMQLAGTIMASSHAATSAVAGEKSSGSRSWDNDSIRNSNQDNSNAFKTNQVLEYATAESNWNNADGSRVKLTGRGDQVITSGGGITSDIGETRYTMEDSNRAEVSIGAAQSAENLAAKTASYSTAQSNTLNESKDWLKSIAQRQAAGNTINYEEMGEQGKSMQRMVSTAETLVKDYGYSWDQAIEGSITGSISASTPGKFLGFGASITADGKITAGNRSSQQFNEKEQMERSAQAAENYNNMARAAQNMSSSNDESIDKTQSNKVSSAYEEQQRLGQELSRARHESEAWHEAQNIINSSGGGSSRDMTNELTERYMKESGINDRNLAHRHVSNRTPHVLKTWNRMLSEDNFVRNLVTDISSNKAKLSLENTEKEFNEFNRENTIQRGGYDKEIEQAASNENFNAQGTEERITAQKENLETKYTNMNKDNNEKYLTTNEGIKVETKGMQEKIDKFEQDRIGQGISNYPSAATNYLTGSNLGPMVGGPQKDTTHLQEPGKSSYENADNIINNDDLIRPYGGFSKILKIK